MPRKLFIFNYLLSSKPYLNGKFQNVKYGKGKFASAKTANKNLDCFNLVDIVLDINISSTFINLYRPKGDGTKFKQL